MVSSFSHLAINENTFTDDTSFRNSAEEHVILGKRGDNTAFFLCVYFNFSLPKK